jgi:peptidoglycan hydrolase CwlO-like protein
MSTIYDPEADIMAEIERLDLEARDIRRRIDNAKSEIDRRVLNKQLGETEGQVELLKAKLP